MLRGFLQFLLGRVARCLKIYLFIKKLHKLKNILFKMNVEKSYNIIFGKEKISQSHFSPCLKLSTFYIWQPCNFGYFIDFVYCHLFFYFYCCFATSSFLRLLFFDYLSVSQSHFVLTCWSFSYAYKIVFQVGGDRNKWQIFCPLGAYQNVQCPNSMPTFWVKKVNNSFRALTMPYLCSFNEHKQRFGGKLPSPPTGCPCAWAVSTD